MLASVANNLLADLSAIPSRRTPMATRGHQDPSPRVADLADLADLGGRDAGRALPGASPCRPRSSRTFDRQDPVVVANLGLTVQSSASLIPANAGHTRMARRVRGEKGLGGDLGGELRARGPPQPARGGRVCGALT